MTPEEIDRQIAELYALKSKLLGENFVPKFNAFFDEFHGTWRNHLGFMTDFDCDPPDQFLRNFRELFDLGPHHSYAAPFAHPDLPNHEIMLSTDDGNVRIQLNPKGDDSDALRDQRVRFASRFGFLDRLSLSRVDEVDRAARSLECAVKRLEEEKAVIEAALK